MLEKYARGQHHRKFRPLPAIDVVAARKKLPAREGHRMNRAVVFFLISSSAWATPAATQEFDPAPDSAEPGSIAAIAEFTTEPRFLSPWVAYVPAADEVPSPQRYLGHVIGAPGELTHSATIVEYVRAIAAASPRVHVETIGVSEEGRDIVLAVIADEGGISELDRHKAASAALADPRRTEPDEAERIIASTRPAYYFNCNLHADETGSGEMCMELVYRLAVSEQPMIKAIRENLLVLVNPVSEPDGRDKVTDWFYRYLKGKTDYDSLPRQSPPYFGQY
ncbi:MAG: M14 family zinc carboxypeptidase, partial [Planctomycetaceae bacterium]